MKTNLCKKVTMLGIIITMTFSATAQIKIGTNPKQINEGSILEMETDSKGVLFPRVTLTDLNQWTPLQGNPDEGMTVYNLGSTASPTTTKGFYYWDGTKWVKLTNGAWLTTGNGGTVSSTNFLGTTDDMALNFRTNNTQKMTILPNGNVGIGTINPRRKLEVAGDVRIGSEIYSNPVKAGTYSNGSVLEFLGARPFANSPWSGANSDIVAMSRVNLGIDSTELRFFLGDNSGQNSFDDLFSFGNVRQSSPREFQTTMAIVVSAGSHGRVGIGTRTPSESLHVIGNILASGTITPSDIRLKQEITPISSGNTTISQLNPITYLWNAQGKTQGGNDKMHYGFIAQELEKVMPSLVFTDDKGYKSVNYTEVIPVLTKAIQEQQTQIESFKKEVEELKNLVNQLLER